ncbi:uncharacterized protein LOC131688532 [Topomyia yanbarensis]|uniref:uncharacterized protein LOC131688532 n=1 Tax=Topomyia yanbarensis TaxID=2498891 RepID=UPI00273CC4DF|nr:uncharacterized protein LOC131688532 [Topomyia yanbarensis]
MIRHVNIILLLLALKTAVSITDIASDFSWDFFKTIFMESRNIVTSGFTIRTAMTLLASTVTDRYALEQMRKGLHIHDSMTKASEQTRRQLLVLSADQDLTFGTKVFAFGTKPFNPVFLAGTHYFDAAIEKRPRLNVTRLVTAADHWCNAITSGMVKNILSPDEINPNTRLIVLNTIVMWSGWTHRFDKRDTKREIFQAAGKRFLTDMMNLPETVLNTGIYKPLNAVALELPLRMFNSLLLIMPLTAEGNMTNLVNRLNENEFKNLYNSLKPERIAVKLPRFSISNTINVQYILRQLHLNAPFDWSVFQIFKDEKLPLDVVKQSVSINVNEIGVDASGKTTASVSSRSGSKLFAANRPFVYVVVKTNKRIPLFVGHYAYPIGKQSLDDFGTS